MKIKSIKAYIKNLQLTKPYTIAYKVTNEAMNAFVEIELDNGQTGYGSAAASEFVFGEKLDDTIVNLQSEAVQKWIGKDIRHFRSIIAETNALFPEHPATRTAIDIGLHDAFGKYLGIPVVDFYGRKHRSMPTSITIGISSVEETLRDAREYKDLGFKILKLKIGINLEEDIERFIKLHETFGNYFKIRVDGNQGYSLAQTIAFIKATRSLGLELVEQPMRVGTEEEMKTLPVDVRKIIACDESLKNVKSAIYLATEPQACGIFNIKLMKCGGLLGAFEIATVAQAKGIKLFWGCYDESIISISAALHAAFACPATSYLDLDGSLTLAEDIVTGGFALIDGELSPLDGPGFGFEKIDYSSF
jgi:L-alanine-DL-glutamate epimerase-like enolase superfamily enzyme